VVDRFRDVRIKIERARQHFVALDTEIRPFLQSEPYRVEDRTEANGEVVGALVVKREAPREWGAAVGDVVHNLRAALDYLAWQLVEANGGTPSRDTEFPVYQHPEGFAERLGKALAGASDEARRIVTQLQPFNTAAPARHPLAVLHALDIRDKHRLLNVVVCGIKSMALTPEGLIHHLERSVVPLYDLRHGQVLYRIRGEGSIRRRVTFQIALDRDGEPLNEVILALFSAVEDAASRLAPLLVRD
jgi:hypothetical protein